MSGSASYHNQARLLSEVSPGLAQVLARSTLRTPARFDVSDIRIETVMIPMRDGVHLATDLYLPPVSPAPAVALRTPYGRGADPFVGVFLSLARRGYVAISQDCRGTGHSEPDSWDYYLFESEDGYDFVEWVTRQSWFEGFVGGCGSSYAGSTQWDMTLHPKMSTIVPEVAGLGLMGSTLKSHMFVNAYALSVGKGIDKLPRSYIDLEGEMLEATLASGYFNEALYTPLPDVLLDRIPDLRSLPPGAARERLWDHYCSLGCAGRAGLLKQAFGVDNITILEAESWESVFGHRHSPYTPAMPRERFLQTLRAPVLLNTGWYDWGLDDTLAVWSMLRRESPEPLRSRTRLFIAPSAHNMPGYHEGMAEHPELHHAHRTVTSVELLLRWYAAVRENQLDNWPRVIFYLMGANEWRCAEDWPIPGTETVPLYLGPGGYLGPETPKGARASDCYQYDPSAPTPTVGGCIVSYVYPPGSVDVGEVQKRPDVLVYTTEPLMQDLDAIGPLQLVLYASSTAADTDFVARLSDVFPDGRAIQLASGILRARYRNFQGDPELMEPGRIYRLEISLWATANRFKAGHRLRIDLSSADFPRFERHSNRAGDEGPPIPAVQTIYVDRAHPSNLLLSVLSGTSWPDAQRRCLYR
ncbi:MAG TPA: CocE/NonD family hydrolase [Steroidobacteraceae bacterium]|nr:CocE/NonD family hydrolase [Steroidobacteraceae bacterium]